MQRNVVVVPTQLTSVELVTVLGSGRDPDCRSRALPCEVVLQPAPAGHERVGEEEAAVVLLAGALAGDRVRDGGQKGQFVAGVLEAVFEASYVGVKSE